MVEGSQPKSPVARRATSKLLADGIERSPEPALAVVQGRAGTGRTSFIVGLVHDLAERSLIPIPVQATRGGSLALEPLARKGFCHYIDGVLSSDRQADEIWHRAKSTRDIVILVDGLDDELVASLASDDGAHLKSEIAKLHEHQISVVLASTTELPLGDRSPLREDLDLFNREEAVRYLRAELKTDTLPADLVEALRRLQDPVDGILIAPFYLDLLVRLRNAGVSFERLPEHRDRSRAAVLAMYLHSIASGRISVPPNGDDVGSPEQRGRDATAATEVVARRLIAERARFAVALKDVEIEDRPLRDAVDLHLLARGAERVGFAVDDLGAYLMATTVDEAAELCEPSARSPKPNSRSGGATATCSPRWSSGTFVTPDHQHTRASGICWTPPTIADGQDPRSWPRRSAWRARARSSSTANALQASRTAASAQSRPMRQAVPDTGTRPSSPSWCAPSLNGRAPRLTACSGG